MAGDRRSPGHSRPGKAPGAAGIPAGQGSDPRFGQEGPNPIKTRKLQSEPGRSPSGQGSPEESRGAWTYSLCDWRPHGSWAPAFKQCIDPGEDRIDE